MTAAHADDREAEADGTRRSCFVELFSLARANHSSNMRGTDVAAAGRPDFETNENTHGSNDDQAHDSTPCCVAVRSFTSDGPRRDRCTILASAVDLAGLSLHSGQFASTPRVLATVEAEEAIATIERQTLLVVAHAMPTCRNRPGAGRCGCSAHHGRRLFILACSLRVASAGRHVTATQHTAFGHEF